MANYGVEMGNGNVKGIKLQILKNINIFETIKIIF